MIPLEYDMLVHGMNDKPMLHLTREERNTALDDFSKALWELVSLAHRHDITLGMMMQHSRDTHFKGRGDGDVAAPRLGGLVDQPDKG